MNPSTRRRSLSYEMLLWIFLLVVAPLLIISFYFYSTITSGLKDLEREQTLLKNHAGQGMFERQGNTLLGVAITNGSWEDNRQALLRDDRQWLHDFIGVIPTVIPGIDFVAEADLEGNIIIESGEITQLQGKLQYPVILEKFQQSKEFAGIVNTSRGMAVIAVAKVSDNTGVANPVGLIIFGRLLNEDSLKDIRDVLQADVALLSDNGQFLTSSESISKSHLSEYLQQINLNDSAAIFETEQVDEGSKAKSATAFHDMSGQAIGVLYIESLSEASSQAATGLARMSLYAAIIMIFLLFIVTYLIQRRIIMPLRHFSVTLGQIATGQQVDSIPKGVMRAEAKIVEAIQQIMQWNQVLEQTVEKRTAAIRNLLNHAGQGFLSFGPDTRIHEEYSTECTRIFKADIAGQSFVTLLHPIPNEDQELTRSILTDFFNETDSLTQEMIVSLLPEEVIILQQTIAITYRIINETHSDHTQSIMIILTDITENRRLEEQMEKERQFLRMVVKVVIDPQEFQSQLLAYEDFHLELLNKVMSSSSNTHNRMLEIFRYVHTFKGNFAQMNMIHIVPKLHDIESNLAQLIQSMSTDPNSIDIQSQAIDYVRSIPWPSLLVEDITVLAEILGKHYLMNQTTDQIVIERSKILALENQIQSLFTGEEGQKLLDDIRNWRYTSFHLLFKQYPDYVQRMAESRGLAIRPIIIEGGDLLVDPEIYKEFAKSLVHIFRNVIVHGIETMEERIDAGKDEYGNVRCDIICNESSIIMTIQDDGRGLDIDKIRSKAIQLGIINEAIASTMDQQAIADLIFEDQLSTKDETDELSGRGIGLAAVRHVVNQMDGNIRVTTSTNSGTSFIIHLPIQQQGGR
ncbi:MAG: ATP-binding protein [Paenibacillaceae bacterium]